MIASVGMAVCKRAATPTALHVIAENSMTCIMSVVQSVRSAVMPQSAARRPTTTSTSVDSDIHIGRCAWTEGNRSPQGRAGERRPISSCFLYRRKPDFLNGQRPLFFTVAAAVVMHRMMVGMVETTRRKTRFPTVGTTSHAKAKPTATATAFCVYVIPL